VFVIIRHGCRFYHPSRDELSPSPNLTAGLRIQHPHANSSYSETAKVHSNLANPYQTAPNKVKADSFVAIGTVWIGHPVKEE
jgi:hypothetical protein